MTKYELGVRDAVNVMADIAAYLSDPKGRSEMETSWLRRIRRSLKRISDNEFNVVVMDKKKLDEFVRHVLVDLSEKFSIAFDIEDPL
jgi:hypothetical protein